MFSSTSESLVEAHPIAPGCPPPHQAGVQVPAEDIKRVVQDFSPWAGDAERIDFLDRFFQLSIFLGIEGRSVVLASLMARLEAKALLCYTIALACGYLPLW